jgi:hypothetical protein
VLFLILAFAFSLWMLYDAYQRRAGFHWLALIFLLQPIGGLIYLIMVKMQDASQSTFAPPASLADVRELELRALEVPSVANKLALANALLANERYLDATGMYQQVLRVDKDDREALHGLARAYLGANRAEEALEPLDRLMELDRAYRDYTAATDYAEALWQTGDRDEAIGLMEGLTSTSQRIHHRFALAHYLKEAGRDEDARNTLEKALQDHDRSPEYIQRRDSDWASRAKKMLGELKPS